MRRQPGQFIVQVHQDRVQLQPKLIDQQMPPPVIRDQDAVPKLRPCHRDAEGEQLGGVEPIAFGQRRGPQ